jgi:hypothetical protein
MGFQEVEFEDLTEGIPMRICQHQNTRLLLRYSDFQRA